MMKNNFFIAALLMFSPVLLSAQQKDYKVVFDLTSKDTLDQRAVIRWLNEIAIPHPDGKFEVVMYGQGFNLVLKDKSVYRDAVTKLADNKNVSFIVCAVAMKNNHVEKEDLLPFVQIVPDGIYEIISKQKEDWGYIKVVH